MKITVEFDSEEEFKARIKNPRGGKNSGDDGDSQQPPTVALGAPPPMMPPASQAQGNGFNPAPQTFAPSGAPNFQPQTQPSPVQALVDRINVRIDGAIASGQPADQVLTWFRQQCGAEAANATLDQIKTMFLPRLAAPSLENIAKLMNA